MNKNAERIIEAIKEMDKLHSEDPRRGDLYDKITEILCEDKEQTLEMIKEIKDPKIFYYISLDFGFIYNKFPDFSLFEEFEKAVSYFQNIDFTNTYAYYDWFKENLEEARALLVWYEEDKKITLYYDHLMKVFRDSDEEERYNIIINTTKEKDIEYYLNLSYNNTDDCIYAEFDFATVGQAFAILVDKYPTASFVTDHSNLGNMAVLFDKMSNKSWLLMRDELKEKVLNGVESSIISYINNIEANEYNKALLLMRHFKGIMEKSKSQNVYIVILSFADKFKDSFLKYFLAKKLSELDEIIQFEK